MATHDGVPTRTASPLPGQPSTMTSFLPPPYPLRHLQPPLPSCHRRSTSTFPILPSRFILSLDASAPSSSIGPAFARFSPLPVFPNPPPSLFPQTLRYPFIRLIPSPFPFLRLSSRARHSLEYMPSLPPLLNLNVGLWGYAGAILIPATYTST